MAKRNPTSTSQVKIYLSPDARDLLARLAASEGLSRSLMIETLIKEAAGA